MRLQPTLLASILALLASCAASQRQPAGEVHDLTIANERRLADEALCELTVDNFERIEATATDVPVGRKALFDRSAAEMRRRDRIRRCSIRLTRAEARCIADARSSQYLALCDNYRELR